MAVQDAVENLSLLLPTYELIDTDLLTFLFSNPNKTPDDKPLYIDAATEDVRTYGDVKQRTRSLAHGLRELGLKPQDIVAFISPNSIDYPITCFAVLGCGATVSPVSAAYTPTEIQGQLETSGAKYLITHSSLMDHAEKAVLFDPTIKIIQADGNRDKHGKPTAEYLATNFPSNPVVSIKGSEASERLSFMCFSSGTTGRAKGVMTTHFNLMSNMKQWVLLMPEVTTGEGTNVTFLPFSHIYGLALFVCIGHW